MNGDCTPAAVALGFVRNPASFWQNWAPSWSETTERRGGREGEREGGGHWMRGRVAKCSHRLAVGVEGGGLNCKERADVS